MTLEVSGQAFGADAGGIWGGNTFWLNVYVEDLRGAPQGVVGGAIDLLFEQAPLTPTGNKAYGADFTQSQQGTEDDANGVIDEAGAETPAGGVGAAGPAPFAAWEFQRDGAGTPNDDNTQVLFSSDPGEGTAAIDPPEFALVGMGTGADFVDVSLGTYALNLYLSDFNHDSAVNHFDLALLIPKLFDPPEYDEEFDLNADDALNHFDLALLLDRMFEPVIESWYTPETDEETLTAPPADSAARAAEAPPLLRVELEASREPGGPPLADVLTLGKDAAFYVNVYVRDLRPEPRGVVGGALDLMWTPGLVTTGATATFGADFGLSRQGAGLDFGFDEAGALATRAGVGTAARALFFSTQISMLSTGVVDFIGGGGDGLGFISPADFALVGSGSGLDFSRVDFQPASVTILAAEDTGRSAEFARWMARFDDGSGRGLGPDDDLDGDTASNYEEWIAGTSAGDDRDYLHVRLDLDSWHFTLNWDSATGRQYQIWRSPSLFEDFVPVGPVQDATPPVNTYFDPTASDDLRFYRLEVWDSQAGE